MNTTPIDPLAAATWPSSGPDLRQLAACLMLGCQPGAFDDTAAIAAVLERGLGDARKVRVLLAVGALLNGDASVAQAELARERLSGQADAASLVFAVADRLAGNSDNWRTPVGHVLATSSDPVWRSAAYAIEKLG